MEEVMREEPEEVEEVSVATERGGKRWAALRGELVEFVLLAANRVPAVRSKRVSKKKKKKKKERREERRKRAREERGV